MSTTQPDRWARAWRTCVSVLWGTADWLVLLLLVLPAIAIQFASEALSCACWRLSGFVEGRRYRHHSRGAG